MKQQLNNNWQMRCLNKEEVWQNAIVPGTVYTDLLRNGQMKDPFWKDNEDEICKLMEDDYEYICNFLLDEQLLTSNKILLHFDGLDTIADIYLNEVYIGHAESMHRIWEYDVTDILSKENNILKVIFRSPLKYIAAAYKKYGNIGNEDTFEGFMHLRKAHYMLGWDWGAHLPDAGIFRPVSLIGIKEARIDSVYVIQKHENEIVNLKLNVWINKEKQWNKELKLNEENIHEFSYKVCIVDTEDNEYIYENSPREINIENPKLWWPNGLGEQPLYKIKVILLKDFEVLDVWEDKIGLRRLTVCREKDEWVNKLFTKIYKYL